MAQENEYAYQVVATGLGERSGQVFNAHIGAEPFLIGKGSKVDLQLDDPNIQDAQARLLVTTTGQVIFINLGGSDSMSLNGEPMASFKPFYWKPGIPAYLGDYELRLEPANTEGRMRPRQDVLVTQSHAPVSPGPGFVIDWGGKSQSSDDTGREPQAEDTASNHEGFPVVQNGGGTILYSEEEILNSAQDRSHEGSTDKPAWPLSSQLPVEQQLTPLDVFDPDEDTRQHVVEPIRPPKTELPKQPFESTPQQPFDSQVRKIYSPPVTSRPVPGFVGGETLPKDWQHFDHLSAQLTINPVNLVAGQRARVPVSVRNGREVPVHLRVYVAGLSREEVSIPEAPITLRPGEIKSFDLIIQPQPAAREQQTELLVRLRDLDSSQAEAAITLVMQINFKEAPNLTGWLDPAVFDARQHTYLHLQNHTKALVVAFITGYSDAPGIHILPAQTRVEIPPGQIVHIPIQAEVPAQNLLAMQRYAFSVAVREGTRAPLDYPGKIVVAPRMRTEVALLMLCFAILLGVGGAYIIRQMNVSGGAGPVSSVNQTLTPSNLPLLGGGEEEATAEAEQTTPEVPTEGEKVTEGSPEFTTTSTEESSPTSEVSAGDQAEPSATHTATEAPSPTASRTPTLTATLTATPTPTATSSPTDMPTATPQPTQPAFSDPRPVNCQVPIPEGWTPYVVQKGDNTYRLALNHGTTLDEVARVNCMQDPRVLHVGNVLLLPGP